MYVLGVTITLYYIPLFAFGIRTALFVENCTLNNRTSTTYSGVVAILPLIKPVILMRMKPMMMNVLKKKF